MALIDLSCEKSFDLHNKFLTILHCYFIVTCNYRFCSEKSRGVSHNLAIISQLVSIN